jgi:hypothetical protein
VRQCSRRVDDLLATSVSRTTILDAFKPYLHQRFNDGYTDAAALYREIREQCYHGSRQTVRHGAVALRDRRTRGTGAWSLIGSPWTVP